ncbi:hypothetical protein DACRYDRAFT_117665 [Dacryopinax primogenitus]|uniref:Methyltransferase domain-containing protein n=1 Tax=Dacryopinax primogenitus (strain DJM 731) TaxID=1858805 RepID=M5G2J6_DACPD|nr:uncharacterized protein DACRYDRAFT_117665 [Dacryopinax primogenitus]EJU00077.1 hypothetical protein DACRYDRAFT_117665 [Dacryopinax primogenitus]
MSSQQPPIQSRGWRPRLVSLTSRGKEPDVPHQASRATSVRGKQSSLDEGYLTDVESSALRKSSSPQRSPSQQKSNGAAERPPVPPLPPAVKSNQQPASFMFRPRRATPDADGGYNTDGTAARSHRRTRTTENPRASTPNPSGGRADSRAALPPLPLLPIPKRKTVHPPCLSDSETERLGNAPASRLSGSRNDREMQLLTCIPYPLNPFDEEARRVEKYMYCAAYYTKPPYVKRHYRGPSFLEYRRNKGPRNALDIGSGYGYWLRDAAASWPDTRFVGFDAFDLPLVEMTVEQLKRISFRQGNLLDSVLPFHRGEFDYVRLANMRLAIPDKAWPSVLMKLCNLISENGILEILDDGWTFLGTRYNANMATFKMSYEEHVQFMLNERGFQQAIEAPRHFQRLVEAPLSNIEHMHPLIRNMISIVNTDPKLDWRWRKTLFLAEEAVRDTLLPIVARTQPDSSSSAPRMTAQEKHDLFSQDVDDLVGLLKVTPSVHRYQPSSFHYLVYQRRTRSQ